MFSQTQKAWIEKNIKRKECGKFISDPRDSRRCGCGGTVVQHSQLTQTSHVRSSSMSRVWDSNKHTQLLPTDAYGVVEFQGAGHGNKANYIRLSDTTEPEPILQLLQGCWHLGLPNLVISIRGGLQNFQLQPKLKRVLCKGLNKAARTTGAWILTGGTNTGVTLHVGDALNNHSVKMRGRIVTIGIAPWGVLNNRENLIGKDTTKPYHSVSCPISKGFKLNSHHTHFLLVDNGTLDQYGCEFILRRRLEKYISQQRLGNRGYRRVPLVSVVIEGGASTIRNILNNVTSRPPIPVVVFDGTGRAADIIAFTHKYAQEDGTMEESLQDQLLETMKHTFHLRQEQVEKLFVELMLCMKKKELITLFCLSEDDIDIDVAILTALLKAQTRSYVDQLSLCLTWNRADIAKSQIFVHGRDWPENVLENIMMEALIQDKVEFVKLLKDNGVNMQKFLTIARLEELYNTRPGPTTLLHHLIRDIKQVNYIQRYTLYDVGLAMESLMGGTYQSSFKERRFKALYQTTIKRGLSFNFISENIQNNENINKFTDTLNFPFNELFVWAVLMGRQRMALFMWEQDEEAMAKGLVASKLYKELAKTADIVNMEMEIGDELRKYSEEFQQLSVELLDHCYRVDDDITIQLITVQLDNWSKHTSLSLAAAGQHRDFLAHPCCQRLMSDLWLGGMVTTKYINLRVILALLCPLAIFGVVSFKSKEELQLMPQTLEEHMHDLADSDSEEGEEDVMSGSQTSFHHLQEDEEDGVGMQSLDGKVTQPLKPASPQITSDLMTSSISPPRKQLRLGKKLYEFYRAPMTKFWAHTMFFFGFMVLYNYMVLVKLPDFPAFYEYLVICYIVTSGMEHVREILASEPTRLSLKLRVFYSSYWHLHEALAITFFLIGMGFRFAPATKSAGRVIYCVVIIMWYLKVLEILSVNIYLGPFVNMIGKMMRDMCYFIILLIIFLMGFGVVRQSVLHPNEEFSWVLLREVFKEPYFMIYGEVYADKINPPCGEGTKMGPCPPGHWTVPVAMAVYLVVSIILLVSLLIAVFNNTFNAVNSIARQLWQFQRYHLTMNYEQKPFLAPPFIIFNHLYQLIKLAVCRCKRSRPSNIDQGLKLFLPPEEVEKLRDFEEACLELYFREKKDKKQSSNDERLKIVSQRIEGNSLRLEEIVEKENHTKLNLRAFDRRLLHLEELAFQTTCSIFNIQHMLSVALTQMAGSSDMESSPEDPAPSKEPSQRLRHLAFVQDREETAKVPLEEGLTPDEQVRSKATFHLSLKRDHFRSFSMDRTSIPEEDMSSAIAKPRRVVTDKTANRSETVKLKRPEFLDQLQSTSGKEQLQLGTKPKKMSDSKSDNLSKTKSPKQSRLSTFERYASMIEQQSPVKPVAAPMPIKRQVGYNTSTPASRSTNHLEPKLPSRDSDSNLSTYSSSSMKNAPHMSSMPRSTPYMSAPVYSTITDHIDLTALQMSYRGLPSASANTSAGYLNLDDNLTSFDGEVPVSPLPPSVHRESPLSEASSGGLQQAERRCFEMMEDATGDETETVDATDDELEDNEDDQGGIQFSVKNEVEIHTNSIGNSKAETTF
ncbi:transient receptor potential cation channel subfamily M member 1-like [Patiria miniata]|uniref:Transient receptor potential cation channel subfamily M member 3 n=1 Tax=Patiria miniata TaxID=46514 RepID=A0A914BNE3_PATMI|nr:transient receptor potential cation channel subfamily M member 1-like [Patiria miniata]